MMRNIALNSLDAPLIFLASGREKVLRHENAQSMESAPIDLRPAFSK
jgi:hypothetical protein